MYSALPQRELPMADEATHYLPQLYGRRHSDRAATPRHRDPENPEMRISVTHDTRAAVLVRFPIASAATHVAELIASTQLLQEATIELQALYEAEARMRTITDPEPNELNTWRVGNRSGND